MDKQTAIEIASTICEQLGGQNKLKLMLGASNFSFGSNGELTFRFKMFKPANHIKIALNAKDLYDITFLYISSITAKKQRFDEVKVYNDIYCDQLQEIFSSFTGLTLSFPKIRGVY
jgi:hypothetical protein